MQSMDLGLSSPATIRDNSAEMYLLWQKSYFSIVRIFPISVISQSSPQFHRSFDPHSGHCVSGRSIFCRILWGISFIFYPLLEVSPTRIKTYQLWGLLKWQKQQRIRFHLSTPSHQIISDSVLAAEPRFAFKSSGNSCEHPVSMTTSESHALSVEDMTRVAGKTSSLDATHVSYCAQCHDMTLHHDFVTYRVLSSASLG